MKPILKILTRFSAILLCAAPLAGRASLDLVGLNFSVVGNAGITMLPTDQAGVSGVRQTNWENIQAPVNGAGYTNTWTSITNQAGNLVAGMTLYVGGPAGGGGWRGVSGLSTSVNDTKMYAGCINMNYTTPAATIRVTGIPYPLYNVIVYKYNATNSTSYGASATIGGYIALTNSANTNILVRYSKNQDNNFVPIQYVNGTGNGYVQSGTASIQHVDTWANVQGGNYVVFSGLTNADFTLIANAFGAQTGLKDIFGNAITNGGNFIQQLTLSGIQIQQLSTTILTNLVLVGSLPGLLPGNPSSFQLGGLLGQYSDGSTVGINLTDTTLTSANTSIFTITSSGLIQPVHAGTANLVVSYQSQSVTQAVTVLTPFNVRQTVSPTNLFVSSVNGAGDHGQGQVFADFTSASNINVSTFSFVSFNNASPGIVSVTAGGLVTATGAGLFNLSATYDGVTGITTNAGLVTASAPSSSGPAAISVKLTDSITGNASHDMTFHDYSGAVGARAPYWNNLVLSGQNVSNQLSAPTDSKGNTVAGVTVQVTGTSTFTPGTMTSGTPTDNESVMFDTYYDSGNASVTTAGSDQFITVSNIPYASYDAYFYVYNDTANLNFPGHFVIDGNQQFIKNFAGAPTPNSDGSGYVQAVPQADFDYYLHTVSGGHYVKYSGLTDSNLTVTYGPAAQDWIGDAPTPPAYGHMRLAGFQIVNSVASLTPTNMYLYAPIPALLPGNTQPFAAIVLANFSDGTKGGNITTLATLSSSDASIFTVDANGGIVGINPGTANFIASYDGLSVTQAVTCLAPTAVKVVAKPAVEYLDGLNGVTSAQASVLATFPGNTNVDVSAFSGVVLVDQGSPVATESGGLIVPASPVVKGAAPVGVTYLGVTYITTNVFTIRSTNDPVVVMHRYSFREAPGSTTIVDSISGANGTVFGPLDTNQPITLDGERANFPGDGNYLNTPYIGLPPGMISSLRALTIELWAGQHAYRNNSVMFAAGNSLKGTTPHNYSTTNWSNGLEIVNTRGGGTGPAEFNLQFAFENPAKGFIPTNDVEYQYVCEYAPDAGLMKFYMNGVLQTNVTISTTALLSSIQDVVTWLGVSLGNTNSLNGWIDDLRIGEGIMSDAAVAASYVAGPSGGLPSSVTNIYLSGGTNLLPGNPVTSQVALLGNYPTGNSGSNITAFYGATFASSDNSIFTVTSSGAVKPGNLSGTASLTAGYEGLTLTQAVTVLAPTSVQVVASPSSETLGSTLINAQASILGTFPGVTNVNITLFGGAAFVDQGSPVGPIDNTGIITPSGTAGSMSVGALYAGASYVTTNVFTVLLAAPPSPGYLTNGLSGGALQLSWSVLGSRLQEQVDAVNQGLGTNWVDVANSTNMTSISIPLKATNGAAFYRLVNP